MLAKSSFDFLIREVQQEYTKKRRGGKNRREAVEIVFSQNMQEMEDDEDKLAIVVGVVCALCKKKELYEAFAVYAKELLHTSATTGALPDWAILHINKCRGLLNDPSMYGDEAVYKPKRQYDPAWKEGDAFVHQITCPVSETLGLYGQYILLVAAGKFYVDDECRYSLYASIIPDKEMVNDAAMRRKIQFVRTMPHGKGWEYLFQVSFTSRRQEQALGLSFVGNFLDWPKPKDESFANLMALMPLYVYAPKDEPNPRYEDHICRLKKRNGMSEPEV